MVERVNDVVEMLGISLKTGNTKAYLFISQLLSSGTNFFIAILLSQNLGLVEYGNYSILWLFPLVLLSFQQSFLISPMYSHGPNIPRSEESQYLTALLFLFILTIGTYLVLFIGLISFTSLSHQFSIFNDYNKLIFPAAIAYLFQDFFKKIFVFKEDYISVLLFDSLAYIPFLCYVGYSHRNLTISDVLLGFTYSFTLSGIIGLIKLELQKTSYHYIRNTLSSNWQHAKWLLLSNLLQFGSGNYVILAVAQILGPAQLGILKLFQSVFGVFNVVLAYLDNVLPLYFARAVRESTNDVLNLILRYILSGLVLALLMLLFSSIAMRVFELFIDLEFLEHFYLYNWFIFITFFIFVFRLTSYLLRSMDITWPFPLVYLLNLFLGVFFVNSVISEWCLEGAAGALLVIQLLQVFVFTIVILSVYSGSTRRFRKG